MMTMLHSVWSGGGSAAGCRGRLLSAFVALLALLASALVWAVPTQAQNSNLPPVAIAMVDTMDDGTAQLDASNSFDPDVADADQDDCYECSYKWEVMTDSYAWLKLSDPTESVTTFDIPAAATAARYGQSIEFKLTVTDKRGASASDTTTLALNQRPTADIAVKANLEDKESEKKGAEKYTVDAVIDGPGDNGNAANEWDIKENALVVLDGSGSSDPNSKVTGYAWMRIYSGGEDGSEAELNLASEATGKQLSTDDADTDAVETVGNLSAGQSPYYVYYKLSVTDAASGEAGGMDPSAVVKLVIWDQPAAPMAKLKYTTVQDDPDTDDNETDTALMSALVDTGSLQRSGDPFDTSRPPRLLVSPGEVITLDASDSEDADMDDLSYAWEGAEQSQSNEARAELAVDKDAEEGTVLSVTVTVTDDSQDKLSNSASVDFVVIDKNTIPTVEILIGAGQNIDDLGAAFASQPRPLGIQAPVAYSVKTSDGSAGGDKDAEGKPTGKITLRGTGFDPDQPAGSLIYDWRQVDFSTQKPIDDDFEGVRLELEGATTDTVTVTVPEIGADQPQLALVFSAVDRHLVAGSAFINFAITSVNSPPMADAGDDKVVEPGSFVRLNGARSSDPDKDEKVASYDWTIDSIKTTPPTQDTLKSVSDQVMKDLNSFLEAWNGKDLNGDDRETSLSDVLSNSDSRYPYFTAPKVADGITDIQLTFQLTVMDSDDEEDTDTVTITVTNKFFSGVIDNPDHCTNHSLGGARTYAFDSDGDGVADVCSLKTTRRAAVATQNALENLVALGSKLTTGDPADPPMVRGSR
jgi:hypothetical protein